MKRIKLVPALLAVLCLLTGCKKTDREMQKALDFRTALLAAEQCTFSAEVTADYGRRVYTFSMDCAYCAEDDCGELTITAPGSIAGISARVEGADASVTFEDVSLELGTMAGGHVAPLQLPQILGNAWSYGYVDTFGQAGDGWLMTCRTGYDESELLVYTYFDMQMSPQRSEVYYEGACVLDVTVNNYSAA